MSQDIRATSSTAEFEREIGASRRRLGATIDALAQRLGPRRLLRDGMAMAPLFFDRAEPEGGVLRHEPLALGLIGAGILWLVAAGGDRRRRRTVDGALGPDREFSNAADPPRGDGPAALLADFVKANPLVAGLAGLALGAALAGLLPPGRGEQERIVRARESLWQRAEALGHSAASRIRDVGRAPGAPAPPANR